MKNSYKVYVAKPKERRPLGKGEDNTAPLI
jgi:hypothetical protein